MSRIAVIDIGTNTFHLLIVEMQGNSYQIVHKEKRSVKIGEGGISKGIINEAASKRALKTLEGFKQVIDREDVDSWHATATSAFRNAKNGEALAQQVASETGIMINIIDGDREAQLIYQGVKHALTIGEEPALIMDIGGGSVEFIIADDHHVHWKKSFEIGAQRLMDHFHYHDPIYASEVVKLESVLDSRLAELAAAMEQYNPRTLIGSSGTFDTLSEIYLQAQGLTKTEQPERPLTLTGYKAIHQQIISSTRAQRMEIPGMIEMRVDMIVVASCLIYYLLERFSIDHIRVSSYALKEGLLMEAVEKNQNNLS